ncbi:hypothetical protein EBR21_06240, partial [bacterium]|nr:hypothetical protein [bacterium]
MHSCLLVTIILACSAWLNACVTAVYQPLSSLRQPVGIDIRKANFNGFAIDLRCQPGALLDPDNANRLCQNVSASLERQGARVQIDQANEPVMDSNETGESENKPDPAGKAGAARDKSASIKLVVELTAKRVRALQNSWYGPLSFYTLTLIPLISDFTDEQRIVIRDENGFVLADQTFHFG